MENELKIVIVDDHQMFLDGIKSLLKKEKKIHFVYESLNAEDALEFIRKNNNIDMLITDISMPGMSGTELTKIIKHEFPHIKVLVLTMFNNPAIINDILQAEAEGYILKNTGKQELLAAIDKIMDNGTFYSNEVMNLMINHNRKKTTLSTEKKEELTPRELEILKLVCEELTTADIAEKLFISPRTVDTHRKNILEKSKSKTIVGLIKYAFENNILE
ncbi:MAG: response regulator transcription factor [Bacteroidetes bacterium]|nr:response regulator transcription factor [Bacteroidota bacterium]